MDQTYPRITAVEFPTAAEEEANRVLCDFPIQLSSELSLSDALSSLEAVRSTNQHTISTLKDLRNRIQKSRDILSARRVLNQDAAETKMKEMQRELGHVDIKGIFSQTEIDDLVLYVNNNPYMKSLLEKRNARLLERLLECGAADDCRNGDGDRVNDMDARQK